MKILERGISLLKACSWRLDRYAATDVNFVRVVNPHNGLRRAERAKPTTNEALPQTVEHVGIYADLSVGLRLEASLVSMLSCPASGGASP
jgi:hypothetical protein